MPRSGGREREPSSPPRTVVPDGGSGVEGGWRTGLGGGGWHAARTGQRSEEGGDALAPPRRCTSRVPFRVSGKRRVVSGPKVKTPKVAPKSADPASTESLEESWPIYLQRVRLVPSATAGRSSRRTAAAARATRSTLPSRRSSGPATALLRSPPLPAASLSCALNLSLSLTPGSVGRLHPPPPSRRVWMPWHSCLPPLDGLYSGRPPARIPAAGAASAGAGLLLPPPARVRLPH